MGFGVPLRAWLRGPLKSMLHDLLSQDALLKRGLFDPKAVSRLIAENEMGRTDHAYSILSLMCIELWCQVFVDGDANYLRSQLNDADVRASHIHSAEFQQSRSHIRQVLHTDPS
jgi:hypothetical protein